jgi:uncharacterized protein (DUF427 family)
MTLTIGTGPFGQAPGGVFLGTPARDAVLYFEASPRWVRGVLEDETVVDSRRVRLLHESGRLPLWYFPREDVRVDLLEPTGHSTHCEKLGDACYWSLRVGSRVVENAAWSYERPLDSARELAGYLAFEWGAMDRWLEEEEEVFGHLRDPYHRLDVVQSSRHVTVTVGGQDVADSRRPKILFETGLPPRYYLPAEDVRMDLLEATDSHSRCAYKGVASYHSVKGVEGGEDVVWHYPDPGRDAQDVRDLLCFYNEVVDLEVDGERQERPRTQWSRD